MTTLCKCGCGAEVAQKARGRQRQFIEGHNPKGFYHPERADNHRGGGSVAIASEKKSRNLPPKKSRNLPPKQVTWAQENGYEKLIRDIDKFQEHFYRSNRKEAPDYYAQYDAAKLRNIMARVQAALEAK